MDILIVEMNKKIVQMDIQITFKWIQYKLQLKWAKIAQMVKKQFKMNKKQFK